ncbi:MAG: hypothetical protein H8E40_03695 [Chloroflexi bacterium]|nr:hypothetical protein [Chloroflexota bacterium]
MKKLNALAGLFLVSLLVFVVSCVTKEYQVTQPYYETEMRQEAYTVTEEYETEVQHSNNIYQARMQLARADLSGLILHLEGDELIFWTCTSIDLDNWCTRAYSSWCNPYRDKGDDAAQAAWNAKENAPEGRQPLTGQNGQITIQIENVGATGGISLYSLSLGTPLYKAHSYLPIAHTSSNQIQFSLDKAFTLGDYAMIVITCPEFGAFRLVSMDYIWDELEVTTREVTKYRDVPVQVEKQRTVTETRQVPFWEAIFGE